MYCRSCQQSIPNGALFCSACGAGTLETNLPTTLIAPPDTDPVVRNSRKIAEPDPWIGLVLHSKYQLLERLGAGGMGAVYRARRLHIGDEVAVKLMSSELMVDDQSVERFRREARAAAMIRHPNVVSIYDFNDAEEAYIVMELVEGVSLRSILRHEGKLSPERSVNLLHAICAGVGVAHRQGLIHRDLKPDNVIVSPSANDGQRETAKVVDFGLAKVRDGNISPLTITGTLVGTAYYMSPEQCRGEELDARADVYSLAAMFYEMITGGPPFTGPTLASLITKHLNEPPRHFSESLHVPAALSEVCMRGLAKNREQRQADAIVFNKELQDALAGAYETKTLNLRSERSRSNTWKWLLAIAALAVLGVGLVLVAIAIKFGLDRASITSNPTISTAPPQADEKTNATAAQTDLRGKWVGSYGPVGTAATLIIKNQSGNQFEGVLEQGTFRVAFKGSIETETIQMKQTEVLSGNDWSLGEDTGKLSNDGKQMSGTGKDAIGGSFGIPYQWSFSR